MCGAFRIRPGHANKYMFIHVTMNLPRIKDGCTGLEVCPAFTLREAKGRCTAASCTPEQDRSFYDGQRSQPDFHPGTVSRNFAYYSIASGEYKCSLHPDISRVHRTCHLLIIGPLDDRSRVGKNRQLISIDDETQQELVDGYLPDRAQPLRQVRQVNLISSSATSHLHRVTSTEAGTVRPTERIKEFVAVQAAGWAIGLRRQLYDFAGILAQTHPDHDGAPLLAFQPHRESHGGCDTPKPPPNPVCA